MRIPTLAVRSLSLAIGLGLAVPSAATDFAATRPVARVAPTTVVVFGATPDAPMPTSVVGIRAVSPSQLGVAHPDGLAAGPGGGLLATVSSRALPLAPADATLLGNLFDAGTPVLLRMDSHTAADVARVTHLFGIAPTAQDVLLQRDAKGRVAVYASSSSDGTDAVELVSAMLATPAEPAGGALLTARQGGSTLARLPEDSALLPARHFDINFVDPNGEVSGVTGIDVVRSRTVSTDEKRVVITSKATVATARNGIVDGTRTNLWGAYLPLEYRLRHALTLADGSAVTYLDHFPETDGRTEYTQVDTEKRGFTIGGSTGSELSGTGKASDALAAKLPFNASFGYQHEWTSSLSMAFQDYSLLAVPEGSNAVQWKALVAPRLKGVLVKRWGAELPQLTEDKMTPMMRTTTFNAASFWKLPGAYEGMATVGVTAGYTLDRNEWWMQRTHIRYRHLEDKRDVVANFVLDMSDPYISAEITVRIHSVAEPNACLRDGDGEVRLAPCEASDRKQMWGLNASSQYVNRGSGRCLAIQPSVHSVVTADCRNASQETQWQWRADRLHSLASHTRYRLYVERGQLRYHAPEGRFADYPVNPYGAPLEPWTNYPNAPRPGIDVQPAPAGGRPLPIGTEWESLFGPVSDDQRWRVEILRQAA